MTKATFLFLVVLLVCPEAFTGNYHKGQMAHPPFAIRGTENLIRPAVSFSDTLCINGPGDSLMTDWFNYASNGSITHNIIRFESGNIVIGRMAQETEDPGSRGTYYAFSEDGETWPPLEKIEEERRGWGNIDQFYEAGGVEIIASHFGLEVVVNGQRGWVSTTTGGIAFWPRMVVGGDFNVHIISAFDDGPLAENLVYTHSSDAGASFDRVDDHVFSSITNVDADSYDITAQGANVAIVSGGAGGDVVLLTSSDHGTSWTEQTIYDVRDRQGELPTGEEEFQPDGSCSILFDNAGELHIAWGSYLAIGQEDSSAELFWSIDAPIMYWKQEWGYQPIALPVQDTTMVVGARDGNFASQPDIAVTESDNIFVTYSSVVSERNDDGNFQHIYAVASTDDGFSWLPEIDITPGEGFYAGHASVADLADELLHIVYNCGPLPWNSIGERFPATMKYLRVPVDVLTNVVDGDYQTPGRFSLYQNYPNPFNPSTTIRFELPRSGEVSLKVFDLLGQEVATLVTDHRDAGTHTVQWDATGQPSGVYFYRLRTGEFVETKKLVLVR